MTAEERLLEAMHRLSELERIENPDGDTRGSIEYERGCIKHLKKLLAK
jgi:hypothetical protein